MTMIWLKQPATDDTVDPEYELRTNDYSDTRIAIQDATTYSGGYVVNQYSGEGNDFAVRLVSIHKTLKAAKAAAEALYRNE